MAVKIETGLFRNTGTDPTTLVDLADAIADALAAAAATSTASATAVTAAASASASAVAASSAITGALATVDAAVLAATTTINTSVASGVSSAAASAATASGHVTTASGHATTASAAATTADAHKTSAAASAASATASASTAATNAGGAAASASTASSSSASASSAASSVGAALASLSGRNAVINGGMEVWNRATLVTVPASTPTFTADRWSAYHDGTGGTTEVSRVSFASLPSQVTDVGARAALRYNVLVVPTSPTFRQVTQKIEGVHVLSGRQVTVSFWTWVATGTAAGSVFLAQNFGSGGSPSSTVNLGSQAFTATTTPTRISKTFTLPSVTGKVLGTNVDDGVILSIAPPAAGTYDLYLADAVVEAGTVATVFDRVPMAETLLLCGRYYRKVTAGVQSYVGGAQTVGVRVPLVPPMRAVPATVTVADLGSSGGTGLAATSTSDAANITISASGAGAVTIHATVSLTAEV